MHCLETILSQFTKLEEIPLGFVQLFPDCIDLTGFNEFIDSQDSLSQHGHDNASRGWSATYLAEQRLWQDPCNEKRYTNSFGYIDWADGGTNPYQFTGGASLESFGLFPSRPGDRMGIAGFYNSLGELSDLLSVLEPAGDVYGGEVYYNAEITPAFHLTFDLQVVEPSLQSRDTAIVAGLRGKIDF